MANDKFKKMDREYCLGDSSVNVYGYRLLTTGFRQDLYSKNPIGFDMHTGREKGVLVRWEDLRVDGDKIYGKPVINLYHADGQKTVDEIEAGFKNAASMGKIICLAVSEDPKLKLDYQTGPTVTEWYPREISLVDIPGNHNALANLYDENENVIELADLADFENLKTKKMSKVILTAAMLSLMDLSETATEQEVSQKFQDLSVVAGKVPGLEKDLADKTNALTAAATELKDLKAASTAKEVADIIATGKADKKLTVELADKLAAQFATNPEGLKDLVAVMPAQTIVTANLAAVDAEKYAGKKWDDLYASNELETIRTTMPDLYENLRKEKFDNVKQ